MQARSVIALFGPTAIGKTAIAIELAKRLRADGQDPLAISVDSMQVYRELPIITGAPSRAEQKALEHKLVGVRSVTEEHDVVTHARLAHTAIDQALAAGQRPIVVGGTGLYLRAALTELDFLPPPLPGRREDLERTAAREGVAALYEQLLSLDPDYAATVDPGNTRRVIRALEAAERGARPSRREENRLWTAETRLPTLLFALIMDRDRLYERIEARIDDMVAAGARQEVDDAVALGMSSTSAQALGVAELQDGDIEALKANTRRYAKRQLSWLRKLSGTIPIDVTGRESGDVAAEVAEHITG